MSIDDRTQPGLVPVPKAWEPFQSQETTAKAITADLAATNARILAQPKTLVTKLAEIMASVHRIAKHGHNDHFNYDFVTESDITAALRSEMAARHLMLVPDVQSMSWREVLTRAGSNAICCLMVRFTVMDGDSGESFSFVVPGEGQDSGDKCIPKAMTSAVKYALLKLFLIPTGDDPERTDKRAEKPSRGQAVPAGRDVRTEAPRRDGPPRATPPEHDRPTVAVHPAVALAQAAMNELAEPVGSIIAKVEDGTHGASFTVVFTSGESMLCYNPKLRSVAQHAAMARRPVKVTTKRSTAGNTYLSAIELLEAPKVEQPEPADDPVGPERAPMRRTDDDIPF